MVPGNRGCGLAVLAAMAMLAPSFAARSAIAKPIPRLAPVINRVRPRKLRCSILNYLSLINFFTFTSFRSWTQRLKEIACRSRRQRHRDELQKHVQAEDDKQ